MPRSAAQAKYLHVVASIAKELYAKNKSLPLDPQGRVILEVSLVDIY